MSTISIAVPPPATNHFALPMRAFNFILVSYIGSAHLSYRGVPYFTSDITHKLYQTDKRQTRFVEGPFLHDTPTKPNKSIRVLSLKDLYHAQHKPILIYCVCMTRNINSQARQQ